LRIAALFSVGESAKKGAQWAKEDQNKAIPLLDPHPGQKEKKK
jgi:hypothetical protein